MPDCKYCGKPDCEFCSAVEEPVVVEDTEESEVVICSCDKESE